MNDLDMTYLIDSNIEKEVPCLKKCRRYTLPDKKVRFKPTGEIHTMIQCRVQVCPFKGRNLRPARGPLLGYAGRIFNERAWRKALPPKKTSIYDSVCDEDILDDGQGEQFLAPDFGDE
jgi:hypothetical protein